MKKKKGEKELKKKSEEPREWALKTILEELRYHEKVLKIYKQDLQNAEKNFKGIAEGLTDHKKRIESLFSLRRYDKASVITNVVLILLLLVYLANEVVKFFS